MSGIDFLGKPLFTNRQLNSTLWQNRDGSTAMVTPSQLVEILNIQKQISQAKTFSIN